MRGLMINTEIEAHYKGGMVLPAATGLLCHVSVKKAFIGEHGQQSIYDALFFYTEYQRFYQMTPLYMNTQTHNVAARIVGLSEIH